MAKRRRLKLLTKEIENDFIKGRASRKKKKGKRMLVIGISGSGKTYYTIKLITELTRDPKVRKNSIVLVFSPTATMQPIYHSLARKVRTQFYPTTSERTGTELKKFVEERMRSKRTKNVFVIIDDLGEETYLTHKKKDNYFHFIQIAAPHLGINVITLWQKATHPPVVFRVNAEYIVLFRVDSEEEKRRIRQDFIPGMTKEEMAKLWRLVYKKDYDSLTIERRGVETILRKTGEKKEINLIKDI